jgi:hypothetical protein
MLVLGKPMNYRIEMKKIQANKKLRDNCESELFFKIEDVYINGSENRYLMYLILVLNMRKVKLMPFAKISIVRIRLHFTN